MEGVYQGLATTDQSGFLVGRVHPPFFNSGLCVGTGNFMGSAGRRCSGVGIRGVGGNHSRLWHVGRFAQSSALLYR